MTGEKSSPRRGRGHPNGPSNSSGNQLSQRTAKGGRAGKREEGRRGERKGKEREEEREKREGEGQEEGRAWRRDRGHEGIGVEKGTALEK